MNKKVTHVQIQTLNFNKGLTAFKEALDSFYIEVMGRMCKIVCRATPKCLDANIE
jgi:hypothetical protein